MAEGRMVQAQRFSGTSGDGCLSGADAVALATYSYYKVIVASSRHLRVDGGSSMLVDIGGVSLDNVE